MVGAKGLSENTEVYLGNWRIYSAKSSRYLYVSNGYQPIRLLISLGAIHYLFKHGRSLWLRNCYPYDEVYVLIMLKARFVRATVNPMYWLKLSRFSAP
jgi:hypothetical protein